MMQWTLSVTAIVRRWNQRSIQERVDQFMQNKSRRGVVSQVGIFILTLTASLAVCAAKTVTVAADGSGDFKTVNAAIAAIPDGASERTVLHIKPGTYAEQVFIAKNKGPISFVGDDPKTTIITYDRNVFEPQSQGVPVKYKGIGTIVLSNDFWAKNITFQNSSGDHGQALALRIDGDRAIVTDSRLLAWQDTLRVEKGRSYFANDYIEGRVDFIYGSGTAVFWACQMHSKDGGFVTAASTPQDHPYGFVFFNCKLTGDPNPWPGSATTKPARSSLEADLGRPWRPYAAVTYYRCEMGNHISAKGYNNWGNAKNETTARYREYDCTGPGADRSKRVSWAKELTDSEASQYTLANILGGTDNWNPLAELSAATQP